MIGQPEQKQIETLVLSISNALTMMEDGQFSPIALRRAAKEARPALDALTARLCQAEQGNEIMREALEWYSREGTGGYMKAQEALVAYDAAKEKS